MMSDNKARIEPEVTEGDENTAAQDAQNAGERPDVETIASGAGDGAEAQAVETPEDRIARLEAETAELRDKWTRALAESENVRRRAERDRRDAEAYGGTRLARDILTVWDNLERAMKAADDELRAQHGAFIEGVELTQRELLNAFAKHKIEKVTPEKGEKFDPNRHQAMFEAPVPGAEPGTVIEVMQDGFVIADRLLRPALVGVARAVPAEQPQQDGGGTKEGGDSGSVH